MVLSEMVKDIQMIINQYGDYDLANVKITTGKSDIFVNQIDNFYITVDSEGANATVNLIG